MIEWDRWFSLLRDYGGKAAVGALFSRAGKRLEGRVVIGGKQLRMGRRDSLDRRGLGRPYRWVVGGVWDLQAV